MGTLRTPTGRARTAERALRAVSWAIPCGGALWLQFGDLDESTALSVVVLVVASLFLVLVSRVVIAAVRRGRRGAGLWALAAGLLLWAAGSAVLNSSTQAGATQFPGPGEWFFIAAYVGFSGFLVLDRSGAAPLLGSGFLDGLVIVGGTACVAIVALLLPFAHDAQDTLPLLIALLYPLLDVTLLLLVVGQVVLGQRPRNRKSLTLGATFVVLAFADATLVRSASSGSYQSWLLVDLAWCLGFILFVDAATAPASDHAENAAPARPGAVPVVMAAALALATLLPQQAAGIRLLVVIPAVITLVAAGLRLVLALRQSQQLNEALRLSRTDDLTGLPNRRVLNARIDREADRSGPLSLMLLDLDGFKEINDTLGHAAGDAVLKALAKRIQAAGSQSLLVVRLGGDEFAVLHAADDTLWLMEQALRIRDSIRKPIRVDGLEVSLDVSIGIAIRDDQVTTTGDLLRQADVAMYQAKAGRAGVLVYDVERDEFSRERLRIAEELRRGIDDGEIVVWYQPKVDAATGEPKGVEALVRWAHPTDGLLAPGVFLPAARRAGLMAQLTLAVLTRVVEDVTTWRSAGLAVQAAVNVAPAELLAPSVMDDLFTLVRAAGLPARSLLLEVTEDSFLADPVHARSVIESIERQGLEVSIDDYGTGFSSLSYLRDLPIQELKIDRSFVVDILQNSRNEMIVRTTITLARGLGLRTVAEGVENAEIAQRLTELGADVLQGYHFARPMPPAQIPGWLSAAVAAGTITAR